MLDIFGDIIYMGSSPMENLPIEKQLEIKDELIGNWVEIAPPEWINILVEILRNPPPDDGRLDKEILDVYCTEFIARIGCATDALATLEKMKALLADEKLCASAIGVIGMLETPETLEILRPFVDDFANLSEEVATQVVNALGLIKSEESRALLLQAKACAPERLQFLIKDDIDYYLRQM